MFHLTIKSRNTKTGPIPVSTSSADTCPDVCEFKRNGCYADHGKLRMHWNHVTDGSRGMGWKAFVAAIDSLPVGQVWRHNQAGDIAGNGRAIDGPKLRELTQANKGKHGFTYSHHMPNGNNYAMRRATANGFTVNLSANSIAHADFLLTLGMPVVAVVPSDWKHKRYVSPANNTFVTCPATYRENVTCGGGKVRTSDGRTIDTVSCAKVPLCAQACRKFAVVFPAHGSGKGKANVVAEG